MTTEEHPLANVHYLETQLRGIAAERPDAVNPTEDGWSCLYNGEDNTHCIIGTALYNNGVTIPKRCEGEPASAVLRDLVGASDVKVWRLADLWQEQADSPRTIPNRFKDRLPTWGEVVEVLLTRVLS